MTVLGGSFILLSFDMDIFGELKVDDVLELSSITYPKSVLMYFLIFKRSEALGTRSLKSSKDPISSLRHIPSISFSTKI